MVFWQIMLVLLIAVIMTAVVKRVPIIGWIANLVLAVFLLGVLFSLQDVTYIADLLSKGGQYVQWIIAIPAGVLLGDALGNLIGKYIPWI